MNKNLRNALFVLALLLAFTATFAGGFLTGHLLPLIDLPGWQIGQRNFPELAPTPSNAQVAETPQELQTLFKPFWETWNIIHEQYVDQPVDDVALVRGAMRGMMEALGDPHSSYMDPQSFDQANSELSGEYEGIGAVVDTTTDYLTILSPMPGSPAERAGLQSGDQVVAIDGQDMTGINAESARLKVIGPAGTTVHLTVQREGQVKPLEFDIVREKIVSKSATGKMLGDGIAYVQVTTFGNKTMPELKKTLGELMVQDPKGLILDLRNNGGGYLDVAVQVTSQFLDHGVVLYEEFSDGTRQEYQALPGGLATEVPMIVLINEGSASASEILAGALQDTGRARLVGVTSFGKGSVQNWVPLSDDQGAVRVTIARWLTPGERKIHELGLTPDVVVEMTDEDRQAGRDPQLDKAVNELTRIVTE